MSFFYSFTETLLHSIWQSALLLLLYVALTALGKHIHPLQKRNALYILLAAQIVFSTVTFILFKTNIAFSEISISRLLSAGPESLFAQYADVIFYGWLIIAFARSGAVMSQWLGFKKQLASNLIRPSADLKVFTELKSYHLGIKRKVTLWYSNAISSPITYGFFKPVILLPFSLMNDITAAEAETIILHELAHIKSKDYLLNWMLVAADIFYFFNPFVRIITKKIKLEREKNCDLGVLNFEYNAVAYAEVLLKIARRKQALKAFQLAAAKRSSQLLLRIQFFCADENLSFNRFRAGWLSLPAALIILAASYYFLPQHVKETTAVTSQTMLAFNTANTTVKSEYNIPVTTAAVTEEDNTTSPAEETGATTSDAAVALADGGTSSDSGEDQSFDAVPDHSNMIIPVALKAIADSVKEFTYDFETPQGKITQSYKLKLINGKWIFEPLYMIMERNPDSLHRMAIDSIQ